MITSLFHGWVNQRIKSRAENITGKLALGKDPHLDFSVIEKIHEFDGTKVKLCTATVMLHDGSAYSVDLYVNAIDPSMLFIADKHGMVSYKIGE